MILTGATIIAVLLFPSLPLWAPFVPAVIEGMAVTPALVFLNIGRGIWSKLHYWYGAVIAGNVGYGVVYLLTSDGAEFAPVDDDGTIHTSDGRELPMDIDATYWYRLGNRPLAFAWDKTDPELVERFAELEASDAFETVGSDGDEFGVLTEPRAGVYPYTPAPEAAASAQTVGFAADMGAPTAADGGASENGSGAGGADDGGWFAAAFSEDGGNAGEDAGDAGARQEATSADVRDGGSDGYDLPIADDSHPYLMDGALIAKRVDGGDDTELSQDAESKATEDFGGDTSLGDTMFVIAGIIALLGGAATALLYIGVVA